MSKDENKKDSGITYTLGKKDDHKSKRLANLINELSQSSHVLSTVSTDKVGCVIRNSLTDFYYICRKCGNELQHKDSPYCPTCYTMLV